MARKLRTPEEIAQAFGKTQQEIKDGMNVAEACKLNHLATSQYYKIRRGDKKPEPYTETVVATPEKTSKVICMIGDPSDIAEALKQWR